MEFTQAQRERIEEIAKKYRLRMALLFGSRATGRTHKESDFDVAYLAEEPLGFEREYRLNYEFTLVFGSDRVDTADIRRASPLLLAAIFESPTVLFAEDGLVFPAYRAYAFKRFVEAKPLYDAQYNRLKESVGKQKA